MIYQVEVKRHLAAYLKAKGYEVGVHLDPMEICRGGNHPPGKLEKAEECLEWFGNHGVVCAVDRDYGKADLVARHETMSTLVVEVEGKGSKPKSQALYSALGQLLLRKYGEYPRASFALAVPDDRQWINQLARMPASLCEEQCLALYLVSSDRVTLYAPEAV